MTFVNANVPLNAADTRFVYAFGGVSSRAANSAGFYRRALDARNWPQIYPLGFLPLIEPTVLDVSSTLASAACTMWTYDVSGGYGRNSFAFTIGDSLNVSLGPGVPPNKTRFDAGTLLLSQFVGNVDVSRPVAVGRWSRPLNVAFGAEYRREHYQIQAGEPDSYGDGGTQSIREPRRDGAQVFPGFRPSNAVNQSRRSAAGYLDVEGDLRTWLRLGAAARTERYSDFGSTVDGKLLARVRPDRRLVVRGSVSTGFRAPSLAQSFFSSTATNFLNLGQGIGRVADASGRLAGGTSTRRRTAHTGAVTPSQWRRGHHTRVRAGNHRRLLPHRHRRSHRLVGQLHGAADCRAARAVWRQQRPVLHECDRHPDDRRRRDGDLSAAAERRRRPSTARGLQLRAHENRRRDRDPGRARRIRIRAVRSHRAAATRVRSAERQCTARRRVAQKPIRREPRRQSLWRAYCSFTLRPEDDQTLQREVAD